MSKFTLMIFTSLIILSMTGCTNGVQNSDGVVVEVPDNELSIPDTSDTAYVPGGDYELVWSDEFNGTEIDTSVWSYETEGTGWSQEWNGEWQIYTDNGTGGDNAYVQDGALVIQANYTGTTLAEDSYTSARLITKGNKSWKHGKVAARMALPFGEGIWPALWMMGETSDPWPACGEIDIMEMIGGGSGDNEIHGTLHWDNNGHQYYGESTTIENPQNFHIYTMEWDEQTLKIGVDGTNYYTKDISTAEFSEFHQNNYLLLNLAVGGEWGGYPTEDTAFPQFFIIDWVRVYQLP